MRGAPLIAALAILAFGSANAEARITETRTPLGKYTLIEVVSQEEIPIMHVNQNWTKLYVRFLTGDNAAEINIIDNGAHLEIGIHIAGCHGGDSPYSYIEERPDRPLYYNIEKAAKALFKICPRLTAEQKNRYFAELQQARSEWPVAFDALKSRAQSVFGGWRRRCVKYASITPGSFFADPDCLRYSARSN